MPVIAVTSLEEFKRIIKLDKVSVFDFWATWCGPCRIISPIYERLSDEPETSSIDFYKVDVDEQPEIAQEVGVRAMPSFMAFRNEEKIHELVGANPNGLKDLIVKSLS